MDAFEARIAVHDQEQAELEEMYATYEALDQADYDEFNAEMDARDAAQG
ncbi:hypothetical protein ACW4TU_45095 (plasmid) [Streptomyces sp. QTS52]